MFRIAGIEKGYLSKLGTRSRRRDTEVRYATRPVPTMRYMRMVRRAATVCHAGLQYNRTPALTLVRESSEMHRPQMTVASGKCSSHHSPRWATHRLVLARDSKASERVAAHRSAESANTGALT